jgi:hypothetical protein
MTRFIVYHADGYRNSSFATATEARAFARALLRKHRRMDSSCVFRSVSHGDEEEYELVARVYRLDRTPPPDADDEPIEPDCDAVYNGL